MVTKEKMTTNETRATMEPAEPDEVAGKLIGALVSYFTQGLDPESARVKRVKGMRPESRFIEDLQFDALDIVECLMVAEEAFDGLYIPPERADGLQRVSELVEVVKGITKGDEGATA